MTVGIVFALFAALAYGTSDFLGGAGSHRYPVWSIAFTGQLAGGAAMLALGLLTPGAPTITDFLWTGLAGAGAAVGTAFLYRGLASGRMGLVAPISAVGAAIIPVLAGFAGGERPSPLVWVGIVLALPGIWLVSHERVREASVSRAVMDGSIAGLGFGVLFTALAQVDANAGFFPLAANQVTGAALTALIAAGLRHRWRPRGRAVAWGTVAGVIGAMGSAAFLVASQSAHLSVAAILTSLYPAVTIVLAALVLRERIGVLRAIGLGVCLVAIALVSTA